MHDWCMWWNQKIENSSACHIFAPNVFYDVSEHDNGDDGCNDENV